jgi:hypothetical protein
VLINVDGQPFVSISQHRRDFTGGVGLSTTTNTYRRLISPAAAPLAAPVTRANGKGTSIMNLREVAGCYRRAFWKVGLSAILLGGAVVAAASTSMLSYEYDAAGLAVSFDKATDLETRGLARVVCTPSNSQRLISRCAISPRVQHPPWKRTSNKFIQWRPAKFAGCRNAADDAVWYSY